MSTNRSVLDWLFEGMVLQSPAFAERGVKGCETNWLEQRLPIVSEYAILNIGQKLTR